MRKSGWAAAGLGSLILLLAACGGSGSSSTSFSSTPSQSTSSAPGTATSSSGTTTPTTKSTGVTSNPTSGPSPHHTAGPQPSSNVGNESIPPIGTTVMTVRRSTLGFVLAEASGYVVYVYAKDHKNGAPKCTGSCATAWGPVTGMPQVSPAVTIPGSFGLVTNADGVKQITYNGYPLYVYKLAGPMVTTGNGVGGVWHVVPMSSSDMNG
jgi:predicted lipoprotein with Yx(FWY)xxD motif